MKDLSAFLDPDLVLKLGGKTYTVRPPSLMTGLKLAAINAGGVAAYVATLQQCPTCGRVGDLELAPETAEMLETLNGVPLGKISLGESVYDQMVEDELPGKHIDKAALYALYYWVLGEKTADTIMAAQVDGDDAEVPPKA